MASNTKWLDDFIAQLQRDRADQARTVNATSSFQPVPFTLGQSEITPVDVSGDYNPWWMRAIDVISRPLYASANIVDSIINNARTTYDPNYDPEKDGDNLNLFSSAWKGLSGKDKTTYSDVIENAASGSSFAKENPTAFNVIKGVGGFVGDVAFDPLMFAGAPLKVVTTGVKTAGSAAATGVRNIGKAEKSLRPDQIASNLDIAKEATRETQLFEAQVQKIAEERVANVDNINPSTTTKKIIDAIYDSGKTDFTEMNPIIESVVRTAQNKYAELNNVFLNAPVRQYGSIEVLGTPFISERRINSWIKDPFKQKAVEEQLRPLLSVQDYAMLQSARSPKMWQSRLRNILDRTNSGQVADANDFFIKAQNGLIPRDALIGIFETTGASSLDDLARQFTGLGGKLDEEAIKLAKAIDDALPTGRVDFSVQAKKEEMAAASDADDLIKDLSERAARLERSIDDLEAEFFPNPVTRLANGMARGEHASAYSFVDEGPVTRIIGRGKDSEKGRVFASQRNHFEDANRELAADVKALEKAGTPLSETKQVEEFIRRVKANEVISENAGLPSTVAMRVFGLDSNYKKLGQDQFINYKLSDALDLLPPEVVYKTFIDPASKMPASYLSVLVGRAIKVLKEDVDGKINNYSALKKEMEKTTDGANLNFKFRRGMEQRESPTSKKYVRSPDYEHVPSDFKKIFPVTTPIAKAFFENKDALIAGYAKSLKETQEAIQLASAKIAEKYETQLKAVSESGNLRDAAKIAESDDAILNNIKNPDVAIATEPKIGNVKAKYINESDAAATKTLNKNIQTLEDPSKSLSEAMKFIHKSRQKAAKEQSKLAKELAEEVNPEDYAQFQHRFDIEGIARAKFGLGWVTGAVRTSTHDLGEIWRTGKSAYFEVLQRTDKNLGNIEKQFPSDQIKAALTDYRLTEPAAVSDAHRAAHEALQPYMAATFGTVSRDGKLISPLAMQGYSVQDLEKALQMVGSKRTFKRKFNDKIDTAGMTKAQKAKFDKDKATAKHQGGYLYDMNAWTEWEDLSMQDLKQMMRAKLNLDLHSSVADNFSVLYGTAHAPKGSGRIKLPAMANESDSLIYKHIDKDLHFPPEAVDNLMLTESVFAAPESFKGSNSWLANFVNEVVDPVMATWKPGMTILRPGHVVRNGISDIMLNVAAGLYSPKHYIRAGQILKAGNRLSKESEQAFAVNFNRFAAIGEEGLKPGTSSVRLKGARKELSLTDEEIYRLAREDGIMPTFVQDQDILLAEAGRTSNPLNKLSNRLMSTRYMQAMARANEYQSHMARVAQYHKLLTDRKFSRQFSTLNDLRMAASREVSKFHPDTSTLTGPEMKYLRRLFPFYSWTKQIIPLIAETAVTRPHRITAVNKAFFGANVALGGDPESPANLWPDELYIPEFMRDTLGYVGGGQAINLGTPSETMADFFNGAPGRNMLSMLNPGIKAPVEMISRESLGSGAYISDLGEYIDAQIPGVNQIAGISGISPTGTIGNWLTGVAALDTQRAVEQGRKNHFFNRNVANFLTGVQWTGAQNDTYAAIAARGLSRGGES